MNATTLRLLPAAALAALALAACGSGDDAAETSGAGDVPDSEVRIERSRFEPERLEVAAGTTVVFVNDDPFDHTVTSTAGAPVAFDSGRLGEGEDFRQTFDESGTYAYICDIHPTMRATVVVS